MNLFLFLGNIGKKYEHTRHNAGFLLGNYLQKKWCFSEWKEEKKFCGEISLGTHLGKKILFLKPHTLMNRSGNALIGALNFYKVPTENILIVSDDKDMEFGKVRFRENGSAGGHNGLKDCFRVLGTQEVARLKIGIGSQEQEVFGDTADFVLARFRETELERLEKIFEEAETKVEDMFRRS